jgi:transcription antitermination factor NusG
MIAPLYACAAQAGRERSVQADIVDLGIWAWVPEIVRPVRPKGGGVVASSKPIWPGYVFARLDPAMFFEVRNVRYLHHTKLTLSAQAETQLIRQRDEIDAMNERTRREIEAGERVTNWQAGARLELIDGPLRDRMATFARIIHKSGRSGYRLQIEVDGMALPVEVNPADVRQA